jgi:galactose mutarotase-like enzyme
MVPAETIRLAHGQSAAWLAPARGGMVTRFSVAGEDVLYLDEATLADPSKNVRGGIPILFPIAGKLAPDMLAGATAPLPQHGFARNRSWRVVAQEPDRAVLMLEADAATRAAYPHDFALRFTYALSDGRLAIEQRFENRGTTPMPIHWGIHPYFAVPDKAAARVATDATAAWNNVAGAPVPFTGVDFRSGEIDLHLLDHRPAGTRLSRPEARDVVLDWSADHRVLVLWTLPGRPFICVEPWSAPANALQTGHGIEVPPGQAHVSRVSISSL